MILNIHETLTSELVEKVVGFYNSLKPEDKAFIYLCSEGGYVEAKEAIKSIIHKNSDITTLIAYGEIDSSAFELFFEANCDKEILFGTLGMYHQATASVIINENGAVKEKGSKATKEYLTRILKKETVTLCEKLGMSKQEIAKIKTGKDVWFQQDRLIQFLENVSKQ